MSTIKHSPEQIQRALDRAADEIAWRDIERDILMDAAKRAWNEPDPDVVRLQDGRQVLREFYDPAIHGPEQSH